MTRSTPTFHLLPVTRVSFWEVRQTARVGVFCTDRLSGAAFGTSNRLWDLLREVLGALEAERMDAAWTRDGYVPSWLARSWGARLFGGLGEVVLVCRPVPSRGPGLHPVGVYRAGSPDAARWARAGEQLSVYDTAVVPVVLSFAQFCTAGTGFTTTTLRPPAPGSARSEVAVRVLLERSGLLRRSTPPARGTSPGQRTPTGRRNA